MLHNNAAPTERASETVRPLRFRRRVLALGIAILLIEGWDLGALGTAGPSLLTYAPWGATAATLGVLGSVLSFGMPLGAFLAGRAADIWGRRAPVLVGLVWVSLSMIISGTASTLVVFAVGLGLTGAGVGALTTLTVAFVADEAPAHRRAFYIGTAQCGVALGSLIVPLVGRSVLPTMSFQVLFSVGASAIVLVPLARAILPGGKPESARRARTPVMQLWRTREWRTTTASFSLASVFVLLLVSAVAVWLPTLLVDRGYDLRSALGFTVAFNTGAIVGTLVATMVADRGWTKLTTVVCLACGCFALIALSAVGSSWLILAMSAVTGVGTFGTQNLLNGYIADSYPPEVRGTALGVTMGLGRVGAIVGPSFLSWATTVFSTPGAGFYALLIPATIAAVLLAMVRPQSPVKSQTPVKSSAH